MLPCLFTIFLSLALSFSLLFILSVSPLLSRKPSCDVAIVVIVVDAVHILPAAFCAAFIVRVSASLLAPLMIYLSHGVLLEL